MSKRTKELVHQESSRLKVHQVNKNPKQVNQESQSSEITYQTLDTLNALLLVRRQLEVFFPSIAKNSLHFLKAIICTCN